MEKKNLKANESNNNFDMEQETKKIQEEYLNEIKSTNGIVDTEDFEYENEEDQDLETIAAEKNKKELERLKNLKKVKHGDRVNYFMVDNDDRLREVSFKFPATKAIIGLSEYGVSGDGRLFMDLTKSIEVLKNNKLFITKFDIDDFCQEELEGFGGFLMSLLRNPRKFIQDLYK